MNRKQRYRYEMLVRVRDFGAAHVDRFPESSKGGRLFGQVKAAVAAVEDHLTRRDLARVEARRVKAATRAAVTRYMGAIARTARRVTAGEPGLNPFRLSGSQQAAAVLSKARLFIEQARPREAAFVEFGLVPTFISDFTTLVDQLEDAVAVRNNGRGWRRRHQRGIESALRSGADALVNLDVLVPNALGGDPVLEGHWQGARRIEGQGSSSSRVVKAPLVVVAPPMPSSVDPPAGDTANPPAVETPVVVDPPAPAGIVDDLVEKAS
jgi:hypothetical protein